MKTLTQLCIDRCTQRLPSIDFTTALFKPSKCHLFHPSPTNTMTATKACILAILVLAGTFIASGQGAGISSVISPSLFEKMLKHRNDAACPANGFYTYDAFVTAANSFVGFATTGDADTQKREVAAFLAQTSHETTGGWPTAPDGPYAWGYCFKQEQGNPGDYCVDSAQWPCAPNQKYYGRGPIQISYNYNYGPAGQAINVDLLNNPDLVATDPTISFKTALWFWMTPQSPKPSSHDVITGNWAPSADNVQAARRLPGYGVITNIINGGVECGHGPDDSVADRIGFYKRYCDILDVSYGDNLDCYNQTVADLEGGRGGPRPPLVCQKFLKYPEAFF